MSRTPQEKTTFYTTVEGNLRHYERDFDQISPERKKLLSKLAQFVEQKIKAAQPVHLIFICTHNSRRSHISQIWGQTAARYYSLPDVFCYSGGTEATAFNPRAVRAMTDAGFDIQKTTDTNNPVYAVRYADQAPAIVAFSKKYDAEENPRSDFAAIMTCSHADQHCPTVAGAVVRISIPYNDPKDYDDTPLEGSKYTERVHEIGREILYAFSLVKN